MLSGKKEVLSKLGLSFLFAALFIVPGTKIAFFNGLPLSPKEIVTAGIILILIWGTPWLENLRLRSIIWATTLILIALQLVSTLLPSGWSLCLQREVSRETLTTPCESSAEYARGERTYTVKNINYTNANFPLHFMNDSDGLNFFRLTDPPRVAIPYSLAATTFAKPSGEASLTVETNIHESTVTINDNPVVVLSADRPTVLPLPADQINRIDLRYTTARNDSHYLRANLDTPFFYQLQGKGVPSSTFVTLFQLFYGFMLFLWLGAWFLAGFFSWQQLDRISRLAFVGSSLIILLLYLLRYQSVITLYNWELYPLFYVGLTITSWFVATRKPEERQSLWPFFLLTLLAATLAFVSLQRGSESLSIFLGGEDEIGHETFARIVMTATSWKEFITAAEPGLFYYQPLYRFIAAGGHKLLGEAMWGMFIVETFLLSLVIYATIRLFLALKNRLAAIVFIVLGLYLFSLPESSLFKLTTSSYQQSMATPLFLLTVILTLNSVYVTSFRWYQNLGLGFLYGLCFMMRTDLLPAIIGVAFYLAFLGYKAIQEKEIRQFINPISFLVGLATIPLLVILRNHAVAGEYFLFPTSSLVNLKQEFYEILPYGPSKVTGGAAIWAIIKGYHGRLPELWALLWGNVVDGFIGPLKYRQFIWYVTPVLGLIALFRARRWWLGITLLLLSLVALVFSSSFFRMHNGVAMLGHLDYLFLILVSLAVGLLVSPQAVAMSTKPSSSPRNRRPKYGNQAPVQ